MATKTAGGSRTESARSRTSGRPASRGGEVTAQNVNAEDRKFLERHKDKLSRSTLRARWIHSPDEHEERACQTLATRSGDVIRGWAEARGGIPATTASIKDGERPRTLRFDFPANGQGDGAQGRGRRLKSIDWADWLGVFEERKLVFLFQEHRRDGSDSNFFRLDSPEREEG